MNLKERYQRLSLSELVKIIENSTDYTPEAITTVKDLIKEKNISKQDLTEAAAIIMIEKIDTYLEQFSVINDDLELPKSKFLTPEQVTELFKLKIHEANERDLDLKPDSWKYVIGGI